jgi:pyrophosphatase PpaX
MLRYQTVLFDLDGTLIDSIDLIVESFQHTLSVNGMAPASDERIRQGIGTPLVAQLATWTTDAALIERLMMTYRAYNNTHHDARVRPYPGTADAVRALAGAGVRLGVVTSKNRPGTVRGYGWRASTTSSPRSSVPKTSRSASPTANRSIARFSFSTRTGK